MMDTAILDISETVRQAQGGDTAAFAVIVRQYQSLVSGVLYSMTGDFHRSEDLAQETFLIAWNKLADLRAEENVAAWLCTIARNLANRSFRKKTVDTVHGSLNADKISTEPEPDVELQRREQSELVWSALEEIPEPYRETLILFYRSGQSIRDIAEATQTTETAVKQKLYRARQSLRSKIEEMIGDVLTDTAPGDVFTYGVMAVITGGVLTSVTETALAATTGASTIVGTTTGTGTAAGKATVLATFWSVLGPVVFYTWLFSLLFRSVWLNIRNAPTLRARRFRLYSTFQTIAYVLPCFIGIMVLTTLSALFLVTWFVHETRFVGFTCLFVPIFVTVLAMPFSSKRNKLRVLNYKTIVQNDLDLGPTPEVVRSFKDVENSLFRAIIIYGILGETMLGILLLLPLIDASAPWYFLFIILGAASVGAGLLYGFYRFSRYLLEMGRTAKSFLATPPIIETPFESALGISSTVPTGFDWKTRSGWAYGVWFWLGFVVLFCWGISWLNWSNHPLGKAVCLAALVLSWTATGLYGKRGKNIKRRSYFGAAQFLFTFILLTILLALECDTVSPLAIWLSAAESPRKIVMGTMALYAALALFGFVVQLVLTQRVRGDEPCHQFPEVHEYDERLQKAIADFRAKETDDSLDAEPTAFPTFWLRFFAVYGIVFLLLFAVGSLFPTSYARKAMLLRNNDYSTLIALEPDNPEYYFQRGCRERIAAMAIADFDTALHLKPDDAAAYLERAKARLGDETASDDSLRLALADCDASIRLNPSKYLAWKERSRIQHRLGNTDAAIDDMTEAIRLNETPGHNSPDSVVFAGNLLERASYFEAKGETVKAIDDLSAAIQHLQHSVDKKYIESVVKRFYRRRAELYEKLGEPDKAKADLERAK